jgi:predicted MFS family arabinose efflux permease
LDRSSIASDHLPVSSSATRPHAISRGLVLLLALACGLTVANMYFVQPLLHVVARDMGVGPGAAGLLVTVGQLGYAAGLLLLVPLGDLVQRRRLVPVLLGGTALAMLVAAVAPSLGVLAAALAVVGITSVVAQILVPFAATLAAEGEQGRVVGTVMTGLMLGTLLSRAFAGALSDVLGWRAVFAAGALFMVALAPLLARALPDRQPAGGLRYGGVLRSVGGLMLREPVLRRRALYGAMAFALFNVFWATLAFLLSGGHYRLGDALIGAFSLIAVPAAFVAPHVGRLADGGHGRAITGAAFALIAAGFALVALGTQHVGPLVAGAFLISLGTQAVHGANQGAVYRLDRGAHSRITAGYMASYFAGGMAGSALAAGLYSAYGWGAVAALGVALAGAALLVWGTELAGPGRAEARAALARR